MRPDWVSNPGPLTYESSVLPNALRGPANMVRTCIVNIMMGSDMKVCSDFEQRAVER